MDSQKPLQTCTPQREDVLVGTFKIPSIKEMDKDAGKWEQYMKRYGGQCYRKSALMGFIDGTMIYSAEIWDGTLRER